MRPARILRVIARMNVGGPAYHVSILCGRLDTRRYQSLLVHGRIGSGEASFADLARAEGCAVEQIDFLGPEIRPLADLRALRELVRAIRRFQPDLVETHTAKAGLLGRLAAAIARRPRPVIVHTYHGHVLEGYFGPVKTSFYRAFERVLARISDRLVGVSQATVDDLVRLRVAPRDRFRVVPLGLDLARFSELDAADGTPFRARVGAGPEDVLLAYVGRLVPIKRLDVLLRALAEAIRAGAPLRLAIVGDGESRSELEALACELGVAERVAFVGYMLDVTSVQAACDVAVLSSDNEGTPVALIEAAATGRPAVATEVGGVPEVVSAGESGLLVPAGDHHALAGALVRLAGDPGLRRAMGSRGREYVLSRFSVDRLTADVDLLYRELLPARFDASRCA